MVLRDADAEPAIGGKRTMERVGKFAVAVAIEPIIVAEARADLLDRAAQ